MLRFFTKKSKKVTKLPEGTSCPNCEKPLESSDYFCAHCGQKTSKVRVSFGEFIEELASGIINYDSKLWKSMLVMITKPGKLPSDYIKGKRARYMNPFRLYLNVTILFFLVYGTYTTFNPIGSSFKSDENNTELTQLFKTDSTYAEAYQGSKNINFWTPKMQKMDSIQDEGVHDFEAAMDDLGMQKSSWNKFLFFKIDEIKYNINNFGKEKGNIIKKYLSQLSISLFILIPAFTFFFKIIYFRKHMYYTEHMVFVFNMQTAFTFLGILFFIASWISGKSVALLFSISFLTYLFIGLKNFYQQGFLKTFIKFIMLNSIMATLVTFTMIGLIVTTFLL